MLRTKPLEPLTSYVPILITRRLASEPRPLAHPISEAFPAAILQADISGLVTLTERLAQTDQTNIEEISRLLNRCFGQLIDYIAAHHGDVVRFTGHKLIAIWPARLGLMPDLEEDLGMATQRAAQCGLAIQQGFKFGKFDGQAGISLKLAVGTGQISTLHLGGVCKRWEFVVTGQPLKQTEIAISLAGADEVIVSPEAWPLLQNDFVGSRLTPGQVRLESIITSPTSRPLDVASVSPEAEPGLQGYIPGPILARVLAGQGSRMVERREVTTLALHLPNLSRVMPIQQIQRIVRTLQTVLYHYEGSLNRLNIDDNGTTLVAVFGLPPFFHEDNAARAVHVALTMQAKLRTLGLQAAAGIATGPVFCGSVGNSRRCEYTLIGARVNLAHHLMKLAGAGDPGELDLTAAEPSQMLCDEATYEVTKINLPFERLPAIEIQGYAAPVTPYRPQPDSLTSQTATAQDKPTARFNIEPSPLINAGSPVEIIEERMQEKVTLTEGLQTLLRDKTGAVVVIEGEPGVGKSRLVKDLLRQAESLEVKTLTGSAEAIEKSSPYYVWRSVFRQLFKLNTAAEEAPSQKILNELKSEPALAHLTPLLGSILPLDLAENEFTQQMAGQVRADNMHDLAVRLLQNAATQAPTLLIIEDAHWLDSASWGLLLRVSRDVQPLFLVLSTRSIQEPLPPEYRQLLDRPVTRYLKLEALPEEDIIDIVCQRLGVYSLPEPAAHLIRDKAQGHPLCGEELAHTLRDTGLIDITGDNCYMQPGVNDLNHLDMPDTIEGIIHHRIDRLMPAQQSILKVASVIGPIFTSRTLTEVYPVEAGKASLADQLRLLEQLDIISLKRTKPEPVYTFQHTITQETAYRLMEPVQRRTLHQTLATWYERKYAGNLAPYYSRLAHHFYEAEVISKAIDYLEKAGEQALFAYANQEAIWFFDKALALAQAEKSTGRHSGANDGEETSHQEDRTAEPAQSETSPAQLRQARWERHLGEAYFQLGQLAESRKHLQQALVILGQPLPATRSGLIIHRLEQLFNQIAHRFWPGRFTIGTSADSHTILEAARVSLQLAQISHLRDEKKPFIYTGLQTLNLAEAAGPSPELALAYATMCLAVDLIPFHSLAETYRRRAQETAESLNDLPTLAQVVELIGLHDLGVGHWDEAQNELEQAIEIFDWLGDQHRQAESTNNLAAMAYHQGKFSRSVALWQDLYTSGQRRRDTYLETRALNGQAEVKLRQGYVGHADEVINLARTVLGTANSNPYQTSEKIRAYGLLALAHLHQGAQRAAQTAAESAMLLIAETPPTTVYLLESCAGITEVYLTLWQGRITSEFQQIIFQAAPMRVGPEFGATRLSEGLEVNAVPQTRRRDLRTKAKEACKILSQFAHVFPIGQPLAWLWQGLYDWLTGQPAKAHKSWEKSLAVAERLAMPYEQGLAHYEIGRHLGMEDPARRKHLQQAGEIFTRLNAVYDLGRVQRALGGKK